MAAKKKRKENFGFKKGFVALIFIFEVILVFTFFDYFAHTMSPDYAVPAYYFTNKILFGTIIAFVTYLFVRKKSLTQKSAIIALVVSALLQIRYAMTGYSASFVVLFFAIHFAILFIVTYAGCKIAKM